jgi:hypothetical protein
MTRIDEPGVVPREISGRDISSAFSVLAIDRIVRNIDSKYYHLSPSSSPLFFNHHGSPLRPKLIGTQSKRKHPLT